MTTITLPRALLEQVLEALRLKRQLGINWETPMKVDTKAAREFAEGGARYTGAEVRLWVHNLCDEVDRLRAELALHRMADNAAALGLNYECHDGAKCSAPDAVMCAAKCRRL